MNGKFSRRGFLKSCVAVGTTSYLSPRVVLGNTGPKTLSGPAEYFVSPQGSDEADGSRAHPFATIAKAAGVLKPGDTCFLRAGVYRETLRPKHSGLPGAEITYSNWQNEKAILTGADIIRGWQEQENGIYAASMPWSLDHANQFFADDQMLQEACWPAPGENPLFAPNRATASGGSDSTLTCDQIPGPEDIWKEARLWCAGGAAWICWNAEVTAYDATTHTLTFKPPLDGWYNTPQFYRPRKGNLFALRGIRYALQTPGQWYYDKQAKQVLIIPPADTDIHTLFIEAKRRINAIDLSDRSYIHIRDIGIHAAGIRTDDQSSNIVLENIHGRYVSHSTEHDFSHSEEHFSSAGPGGILIRGNNILLLSCDLGYSSSAVVGVAGYDNRIINCNIHHGGYTGFWLGTVVLTGRRIVFSHNTVSHAGRDLINTHYLMESLVQYNDVSDAGWLTKDLGMFYGHDTDFANTVFRYNLVHDNHAEQTAMGIYFDHLSHNAIVHNNVIWNAGNDPIRFNNPAYCNLIFNNTCLNTGKIESFDHSERDDLFACRYFNNIFNDSINLPDHVVLNNNRIIKEPFYNDPGRLDFRLKDDPNDKIGAYAPEGTLWKAGCDLKNPPNPLPAYEAPRIEWMNLVRNSCFEFGSLEGWDQTDSGQATLVKGNGWGNPIYGNEKVHPTGTSKYEMRLGPDKDGIMQEIKGLSPNTKYTLSAWMRVAGPNDEIVLGVKGHGNAEANVSAASGEWIRKSVEFTTGSENSKALIYLKKTTDGSGFAWCDNITLPLTPKGKS